MHDETNLNLTRYMGEGVFVEDSHGNQKPLYADKYGYHKVETSDGDVNVFIEPNTSRFPGDFLLRFFAPRKVSIVREELLDS